MVGSPLRYFSSTVERRGVGRRLGDAAAPDPRDCRPWRPGCAAWRSRNCSRACSRTSRVDRGAEILRPQAAGPGHRRTSSDSSPDRRHEPADRQAIGRTSIARAARRPRRGSPDLAHGARRRPRIGVCRRHVDDDPAGRLAPPGLREGGTSARCAAFRPPRPPTNTVERSASLAPRSGGAGDNRGGSRPPRLDVAVVLQAGSMAADQQRRRGARAGDRWDSDVHRSLSSSRPSVENEAVGAVIGRRRVPCRRRRAVDAIEAAEQDGGRDRTRREAVVRRDRSFCATARTT